MQQSQSSWAGYGGGYGLANTTTGAPNDPTAASREPGARRKKLAAMAGSVYRAGVAAAGEIREQYNNTRIRNVDNSLDPQITIPGSFPDVRIVVKGDEQMVLFPSYAKRHIRQFDAKTGKPLHNQQQQQQQQQQDSAAAGQQQQQQQAPLSDEEYWRQEWARMEDEKAIVDVDVRGWIYSPHKGQMTRKNRMLIGLARRLSGIPPPTISQQEGEGSGWGQGRTTHEEREEMREQQRIAREAEEIERRGRGEEEIAERGGYSEGSSGRPMDAETSSLDPRRSLGAGTGTGSGTGGSGTPVSPPSSPSLSARPSVSVNAPASELTEAELAVANANLMARLGPFLTTPRAQLPITVFFYNEEQSQSRTVTTNDAGHFSLRAALEFVPTQVRVLANEDLSATEEVRVIEKVGVSLISDIDDTIKRSNISLGAREIFRNTFIRDLADMSVEGIREWYGALHGMGVQIHYCSNSPWQLFPVLATFFHGAGLPPGSLHLKQYSGMLQGIFEPVAERKRGTLERILADFPERKFLLVGDSGEADLEVYTELAQANPGRILAIFIRDVTTPEKGGGHGGHGFFDSGFDPQQPGLRSRAQTFGAGVGAADRDGSDDRAADRPANRPGLPPRLATVPPRAEAPTSSGDLIDLTEEPEQMRMGGGGSGARSLANVRIDDFTSPLPPPPTAAPASSAGGRKLGPPARPAKPPALRSAPSDSSLLAARGNSNSKNDQGPPVPTASKSGWSSSSAPAQGQQHQQQWSPGDDGGGGGGGGAHPLSRMRNSSQQTVSSGGNGSTESLPKRWGTTASSTQSSPGGSSNAAKGSANGGGSSKSVLPPPPPPRRRGTPSSLLSLSPRMLAQNRRRTGTGDSGGYSNNNADVGDLEPLPPSMTSTYGSGAGGGANNNNVSLPSGTGTGAATPANKKLDLWYRRLERAQEVLLQQGVQLYTWRKGDDVIHEAKGIVAEALKGVEREKGGWKGGAP